MRKFKTAFLGYKKREVLDTIERMQKEHEQKKQVLEHDLQELLQKIDSLEQEAREK